MSKNMITGIKSTVSVTIPSLTHEINNLNNIIKDTSDSTKYTIPFNFHYNDLGLSQVISGGSSFHIKNNALQLPIKSVLDTNNFNIKLRYIVKEKRRYLYCTTSLIIKFN